MAKGPSPAEIKKHSKSTIKKGSKGAAVECFQKVLNANGAKIEVDGQFGSGTKKAVEAFQKKKNLGVDGIVGPKTWGAASGQTAPQDKKEGEKEQQDSSRAPQADPNSCVIHVRIMCPASRRGMQPVQGCEVRIGKVKKRTRTGGEASLTVPAGRYVAQLKKRGYEPVTDRPMEIRAIAGGTLEIRFEMRPTG